jgi:hypothetical protein
MSDFGAVVRFTFAAVVSKWYPALAHVALAVS